MIGPKVVANSKVRLSGRITSAVPFSEGLCFIAQSEYSLFSTASEDRKFIAVGCSTGVYAARRGSEGMSYIMAGLS